MGNHTCSHCNTGHFNVFLSTLPLFSEKFSIKHRLFFKNTDPLVVRDTSKMFYFYILKDSKDFYRQKKKKKKKKITTLLIIIMTDPAKTEAITKMPLPRSVNEPQRFLGMVNYIGKLSLTLLSIPLHFLTSSKKMCLNCNSLN